MSSSLGVVEVEIAGRRWAVPAEHVREVQPLTAITTLPLAPAEVAGLTQVRGRVLVVLRPADGSGAAVKEAALVIVEVGEREAALWVDRVVAVTAPAETAALQPLDVAALFARVEELRS